ncbi:hypothetical protein ACWDKQ_21315 [Saccharopolyspora sp. NPDC000995]
MGADPQAPRLRVLQLGLRPQPAGRRSAAPHRLLGATDVSMHVLAAMQLTGQVGGLQLPGADLGAVFSISGAAVANYASVLERVR